MGLNKAEVKKFLKELSPEDQEYIRGELGGGSDEDVTESILNLSNRIKALEDAAISPLPEKPEKQSKPQSLLTRLLNS